MPAIQHASDPMVRFSPSLAYEHPNWLIGERGEHVSPYLQWYRIVKSLQVALDLPLATTIPIGYGHNSSPAHYIDARAAVTAPVNWSDDDTHRLERHSANR